jgi:pimeloyl-ACP methyl ester carboxylesterase
MKHPAFVFLLLLICIVPKAFTQPIEYPYKIRKLYLQLEQADVKMAYMDVSSTHPNGRSVILFHGKNFDGYYWKDIIPFLNDLGYRVIVPDQVGFGESDKPGIHYSFHAMAAHNKVLLDSLGIDKVTVIGHSMGGMLAARFVLMYPSRVDRMILENPIGLEDYRTFVPYVSLHTLYTQEVSASYASYKAYQQTYYPEWKPEYEQYVRAQARQLSGGEFKTTAWANALTYQMIYEQPVCYEWKNIRVKTLLIIGIWDRTIVGKARLPEPIAEKHGQYQVLGRQVSRQIKGSVLVELKGVGHLPHIQSPDAFKKAVKEFLAR